ncbi:MAG TPA: peroxiredoxin [Emcibacteraceae bacterium]|nr:peroxiredoxin [Emcibacteraceae bacterium]HRW30389.1 peroxiredoxin [Emcibacteraceae bacterium]
MNDVVNPEKMSLRTFPRINDMAPEFTARTTQGVVSLSDYAGKWLILFSHPADFTPVCTSEFIELEKASDKFAALNCELLGLSADSVYSHIAWLLNIEERFGVKVNFPIIEDLSLVIAEAYGMIDEQSTSTATVRSVYFINPEGIIKAHIHYPMSVGRSVDEILRILSALVATEAGDKVAPAGWREGDKLVLAPPVTMRGVRERMKANQKNSDENSDWYFTKIVPEEQ